MTVDGGVVRMDVAGALWAPDRRDRHSLSSVLSPPSSILDLPLLPRRLWLRVPGHQVGQGVDRVLAFEEDRVDGLGDRHFDAVAAGELHDRASRRDAFGDA